MLERSPNFKDTQRHSGSPVPLRSPSPDFMTKSAIVNTPQSLVQYKQRQTDRLPLIDQVKYLREENRKLLQTATGKGQVPQSSLNEVLKEKDRLIDNLKNQLKLAESGKGKGAGLSLLNSSGHKHSPSDHSGLSLKEENEELRSKVRKLFDENEELRRRKSGESGFQKPKPNIEISSGELNLSRSNVEKIKEQLGKQLLASIDGMMNTFSLKLRDIEYRVSVIEGKLREGINIPSGSKGKATDIGNQSPFPISNFGTASKNNKYGDNNFNTPPPSDRVDNLGLRIQDLEHELSRSKQSESSLNHKIAHYQRSISDKENEVETLGNEVRRLKNELKAAQIMSSNVLTDSQAKNRILEENISLKQSLTGLSAQLSTTKNDKLGVQRQNQLLKKELEIQRKNRISPLGASQTDQHIIQSLNMKIQNYENNSKQLVNETISLRDTLAELRKTNNQIVNELDQFKRQNSNLRIRLESMERDKSDLEVRVRADSSAQIAQQTENMKLRLRINELQEQNRDQQSYASQIKTLREELGSLQAQIRELKTREFDLEGQNNNLRRQAQRAYALAEENEMLKRSINNSERANKQLLDSSDHTKNEMIRINQDKLKLQNDIIEVKSTLKLTEGDLVTVRERMNNLEKEYRKLEQQNNMNIVKINQAESTLNNTIIERDNLTNDNQNLNMRIKMLEFENMKLKNDNQKEDLLNQVNILTSRLQDSERHLSNSKRLEEQRANELVLKNNQLQQKNNELLLALRELSQVKKLLLEMNFDSVEGIVRELQHKERQFSEQKQEISRLQQQSSQQLTKLAIENDRLKKDSLDLSQKLYEQKERADRFSASINQLEAQKVALNERIARLDQTIRLHLSQDNTKEILTKTEYKAVSETSHSYDQRVSQRQFNDVRQLREPVSKALHKLDNAAEKISKVVDDGSRSNLITQTQSYLVQSNISSNVGDSRRK